MASRNGLRSLQRVTVKHTGLRVSRTFSTVHDVPATPFPSSKPTAPPAPPVAAKTGQLHKALNAIAPRNDWTKEDIQEIYETPLMELIGAANQVHKRFHPPSAIQLCTLMNIKTGGCSEDCSYCAQSSRYSTGLKATKLSPVDEVLEAARIAKANGSNRFCMGAAWRDMRGRKTNLKNIKAMVTGVREMGMEACVTLGMIDAEQAKELKDAGLTAYNHNIDTSREHYPSVITTRSYDERLATIQHVADAGIHVCTGGILGLGEKKKDHIGLVYTLATLPVHPESVPINTLVPIKGTPLGDTKPIAFDAVVRTIATARVCMPGSIVRLAAGRVVMSEEKQMLCFMAGANAVFTGEKMLTTDCNGWDEDKAMFERWGLRPMKSEELKPERENLKVEVTPVKEKGAEASPSAA